MKKLLIVLLSACTWWACDKGDDGAPSSIVLTGGSGDQTIYADETSVNGGQGIAFEAAEAWYAEVSEVQAKASSGEVDWLTLSAYEGGAGQYTLQITLRANETGSDRAAEIRIVCDEDEIVIVVRQKAQTKDNQSVVVFEDEAFRQFCVDHFDADRNGMITDSEVSSVDSLSVPSMEIVSLKGIEAFASLRKLYCYDNKIEALDLSANGELTVLGCHYNDLEELSLSANTKLTSLNCNHNRISKLDLSALTELRELHVQYNELGELDLSGNPRLGILQCMENRLTELDITKCPDLTMLWADPMPTLETLYWTQAQADNMFALIFVPESTEKVVRE